MVCDCHSYNADTGEIHAVALTLPDDLCKDDVKRTFCIDACIANVIKHLWENKIVTKGCCCGHNKNKPWVILEDSVERDNIDRVKELIKEVDNRDWQIKFWQLITY